MRKFLSKIAGLSAPIAAAWFPGVVVFVCQPMGLYLGNRSDLGSFNSYLLPFLVAAFIFLALSTIAVATISERRRAPLAMFMFGLGAFLMISDIVAPLDVGMIAAGDELKAISVATPAVVGEVVSAVMVWLILSRLPASSWLAFARATVVGITILQIAVGASGLQTASKEPQPSAIPTAESSESRLGNVYHIVLDSFGPGFYEAANSLGLLRSFSGFTLFENTLTNADYTQLSMPVILHGQTFRRFEGTISAWRSSAVSQGILRDHFEHGYQIRQYNTRRVFLFPSPTTLVTAEDKSNGDSSVGVQVDPVAFADIVLLRALPSFVGPVLFVDGEGLLARTFQTKRSTLKGIELRGPHSVRVFRRMIDDEAGRPGTGQYVFSHLLLPHSPYVLGSDCRVRRERSTYQDHVACAARLMAEFVEQLRASGHFDDALIVVHGDHGPEQRKPYAESFFKDPRTLLLIKPPGAPSEPIVRSQVRAQLLDIAPTIHRFTKVPSVHSFEGADLFSLSANDQRPISVYTYKRPFNGSTEEMSEHVYTASDTWITAGPVFPRM